MGRTHLCNFKTSFINAIKHGKASLTCWSRVILTFGLLHPNCCGIYHSMCPSAFGWNRRRDLEKSCRKGFLWPISTVCDLDLRPHVTLTFDCLTPKVNLFMPFGPLVPICIEIGSFLISFQNIVFTKLVTDKTERQTEGQPQNIMPLAGERTGYRVNTESDLNITKICWELV